MKFGSVRFFKRLIVVAGIVLVAAPIILAVTFGILFGQQKKRADFLETVNWALLHNAPVPGELQSTDDLAQYFQNMPEEFVIGASFDYQLKYPELYYDRPATVPDDGKVCYLTFDDGPSPVTLQLLKTLDDYGIKATFFVTGANSEENTDALLAAARAGHTVAVHTYSHDYPEIYQSVNAYLDDFERMHSRILGLTGASSGIFRFAGGSINGYNQAVYEQIIAEMLRRGFTFFDWNVEGGDAVVGGLTREQIVQNVLNGAVGKDKIVVLMHDRHENATTAAALPLIIDELAAQGYRFEVLSAQVPPITYYYRGEE